MDSTDLEPGAPELAVTPVDPWADVPPEPKAPQKLPKWPFFVAGFLLLVGASVAAAWPINVPYYALSPGPVNDTSDFVTVPDPAGEESGDLLFLTVSLREINALEYLGAILDEEVDLSPRENIRPVGVSQDELRRQNINLMETSKTNATYVALTRLGYDVTFEGAGALVTSIVQGSAADGVIEPNDVIVSVDGEPVEFSSDAVALVSDHLPGDTLTVDLERADGDGAVENLTVDITLGPFRFELDDGTVDEDPDRGMVGVLLDNAPGATVIFPVDVDIDAQNIGGPSAGLMFALEIMNQLTEDDLTKGHRIAGTGTIDAEGNVGSIGGIHQKVYGAIRVGAEYVLVPGRNYEDALEAAGDDIVVVEVVTIDDALAFLEGLPDATA